MVQNYVGPFDDDEKYIVCLEPGCTAVWEKKRKCLGCANYCPLPLRGYGTCEIQKTGDNAYHINSVTVSEDDGRAIDCPDYEDA